MNGHGSRRRGARLLATRRLSLHELALGDVAELVAMDSHPRVHGLLLDDHASTLDQGLAIVVWADAFYRAHPGLGIWSTYDEHGRYVGIFSLMPVGDSGDVEIGVRLQPFCWGRGYPVEAGRALCRHAFETLQLPRLLGFINADNRGAQLALRRLGFEDDGACLHFEKPALRYVLDRRRWQHVQERLQHVARSGADPS